VTRANKGGMVTDGVTGVPFRRMASGFPLLQGRGVLVFSVKSSEHLVFRGKRILPPEKCRAGILRVGREFSAYPFLKMYFENGWSSMNGADM